MTGEDYEELERERDELKAELRKYEPSDGVMQQLLALNEAIAEAAKLFQALVEHKIVFHDKFKAWLALPVVKAARKP